MNTKLFLSCILIIPVFLVLVEKQHTNIHFTIQGNIVGLKDDSVFLVISSIDSETLIVKQEKIGAVARNGKFTLSGEMGFPTDARIWLDAKGRKVFTIFPGPGTINARGNIDSVETVRITGTPDNDWYTASNLHEHIFYDTINVLYKQLNMLSGKDSLQATMLNAHIDRLRDSVKQQWIHFINEHPEALASGIYVYVVSDKVSPEEREKLYNSLSPTVKKGWYATRIREAIGSAKRTAIGMPAPDYAFKDMRGKQISLSFLRGKYFLLDFWASWCVPCRAENPNLLQSYKKFKSRGFEIISVTLDNDSSKWKEAMIKDSLPWTQTSVVYTVPKNIMWLYGVSPIPDNFLISPEGKIIGRNLRGDDIDKMLSQYIK